MLITGILNALFSVIQALFGWINLPDMPDKISSVIDNILQYVIDGLPIIWCFLDKEITLVCLGVALACRSFEKIYDFLMWLLAKLPIGIKRN